MANHDGTPLRRLMQRYHSVAVSGAGVFVLLLVVLLAACAWIARGNGFRALVAGVALYVFLLTGLAAARWQGDAARRAE